MMDAGKAASARLHEIAVEIIRLKLCPGGMQSFSGLPSNWTSWPTAWRRWKRRRGR